MDDNDLIEIGIIQALHRDAILRAAQSLPYRTPKLTRDQIQQLTIAEWLTFIHLNQYVDIFHNNGLTELRKIRNIWEVELETMLEIDKCGHRRRILYSLSDFNQRDSMIVSDNSDALSPWLSTDNASVECERDRNEQQQQQQQQNPTSWKGWKHARHELINGECKYLVTYLGSTLVRELRGIDSTRASIGKLKSATANSGEKILKILLSISCHGVQFKDSKSNRLICEHEIRNIHCICQDSEDLNYFAYITKDFETNNHYCHVFMSTQTVGVNPECFK
ncbi:hypothetical protein BLA29_007052 [Euroglyphus maynei]|uniref:Uncharacterized protein n=1 Tax=Euroglyphus maynei TaxID=6958 RepID=A0A1Y3B044_EURMA|nr:hypothetical protein BLA29_007052 [Euroglyphus maynei]